ncbi:hypothetical protein N0V88_006755 [Collariella sp. IMI 366227]|nr:hypothetical protein N0V88_006755 [Collariella sp. IMI 366227]
MKFITAITLFIALAVAAPAAEPVEDVANLEARGSCGSGAFCISGKCHCQACGPPPGGCTIYARG